jgi:hypothetical protein
VEIFTGQLVSIDAATGVHDPSNRTMDDVTNFWLCNAPNLVHFPKNVEKVFKNIQVTTICNSKLQVITKDDLKVFPQLRVAHFNSNELRVIAADTFEFNPDLERIDLEHNLIFHIEPHTFDGLMKLEKLYLTYNDKNCGVVGAVTESEIVAIIEDINAKKCFSPLHGLERQFDMFLRDEHEKHEKLEKRVEQFEVLMSQMLIQIQVLTKKFESVKN